MTRPMSLLTTELAYVLSVLISAMLLTRLLPHGAVEVLLRNTLNERSAEHCDVASMTARICTTLENSGNISNRSFSCIAPEHF